MVFLSNKKQHDAELEEMKATMAPETADRAAQRCKLSFSFVVFLLLALSFLLIFILFGLVPHRASRLHSELRNLHDDLNKSQASSNTELSRLSSELRNLHMKLEQSQRSCQLEVSKLASELSDLQNDLNQTKASIQADLFPCGPRNKKWEYFDGGCYYFSVQKGTWQQAKTQCENQGSHLVVIDNVAEQNFLESHTKNILYYIGLTDVDVEGQWRWVDGTNYEKGFKKWLEGEPNNSGKNEHCAHLNRDGKWNDVPCDRTYFYVCEKTLPSRSTMR